MSEMMSVVKDEQENYSMARVLLVIWTMVIVGEVVFNLARLTQPLLTFLSSIYMFLCAWAGGPRAMQYLAPVIGSITSAIGQAKNVETSTDIQELVTKAQTTKATEIG